MEAALREEVGFYAAAGNGVLVSRFATMPQSFSPCRDMDYDNEPLLFDEEICQYLLKDLDMIKSSPPSPLHKHDPANGLSDLLPSEQLEFFSNLLFEDRDMKDSFAWGSDFIDLHGIKDRHASTALSEDCVWHSESDKSTDEQPSSVLSSSPLASNIEGDIFDLAATSLDCHHAGTDYTPYEEDLQESLEQSSSEDDSSLSAGTTSSSDSDGEIDVVTVEKSKTVRSTCTAASNRLSTRFQTQKAMKRRHLEIQLQHNYAAPCPSLKKNEPLHHKRQKIDSSRTFLASKSRISSTKSSDLEEEERRRTHNVMERQRRNELKNCFLRLRDNVPELSNNDKASKVNILKKARECIRSLETNNRKLSKKRDKLQNRQEQLKNRLEQLQRLA
ncbi:myelocytomatosis oncogene homolog [Erpetoichthys calabaricus]|uniref:Myelocytomatosis oncogene homolog n=1 Tax=Erpetoichthys calabaricus TaxID=27687 RepID=A0A8C4SDS6_ERPCA|nr:myelocytomatosis oncogene homolog [Erpetoichthys calabaricus]